MIGRISVFVGAILMVVIVAVMLHLVGHHTRAANEAKSGDTSKAKANNAEGTAASEQWEYLVVSGGNVNLNPSGNSSMRKEPNGSFSRENFPLQQNLDKLGAKGWELISVTGNPADPVFYFKRRK
jgi:hypothetical protein